MPAAFHHLLADLTGVPAAKLADERLLAGLLVAAAGAAGLAPVGSPVVRTLPSGAVVALLLVDGCHIAAHAFAERELLLLDVLSAAPEESRKALDVFTRRLSPHAVRSETRERG